MTRERKQKLLSVHKGREVYTFCVFFIISLQCAVLAYARHASKVVAIQLKIVLFVLVAFGISVVYFWLLGYAKKREKAFILNMFPHYGAVGNEMKKPAEARLISFCSFPSQQFRQSEKRRWHLRSDCLAVKRKGKQ